MPFPVGCKKYTIIVPSIWLTRLPICRLYSLQMHKCSIVLIPKIQVFCDCI